MYMHHHKIQGCPCVFKCFEKFPILCSGLQYRIFSCHDYCTQYDTMATSALLYAYRSEGKGVYTVHLVSIPEPVLYLIIYTDIPLVYLLI